MRSDIIKHKAELRRLLLQYPDVTEMNVEDHLYQYEMREEEKDILVSRGYSNLMAERYLDIEGWPRPPGWHSVFFYPESYFPRIAVIIWHLIIVCLLYWLF